MRAPVRESDVPPRHAHTAEAVNAVSAISPLRRAMPVATTPAVTVPPTSVAPATLAASTMSSETCARPASRSSDMNGVVFQISETMIAMTAGTVSPNQLKSASMNGNQPLTKPFW